MQDELSLKKKAEDALKKSAAYGEDLNLDDYAIASKEAEVTENLMSLSADDQKTLLNVGVVPSEENRSGTFIMLNNAVSHTSVKHEDVVELMSLREAMQKYDWVKDYSWKLVKPDADKYTAMTYLQNADGYFIRAPAGKKSKMPVQTCLLIGSKEVSQTVHNIIVVEEGAQLDVITGCSTKTGVEKGLHLGISEMYVKKGATLNFTMIHNWAEQIGVRPRTVVHVEEGGTYINNYITLKPVKSIQMYPTIRLEGKGAFTRLNSIGVAHPGSELDLGSRVIFDAPDTKAEIISRTITTGGKVIARGEMIGNASGAKGHLECHGLVISAGTQRAIPILEANVEDIELSHEAAVGRIAREQIEYLMARGLTEDEAVGMIVRGFLDVGIQGIPDELKASIDETIAKIGEKAI
ncbi:ABC-type transport system involved in Fe-S cluster assembly, permease component [Methanomethylovorans hollandica DSM 15978]|jgi:Fe-S cluster assembly scaffold protein SufB|uniref:ABC-type transport system involved in Fe-S cluster assembly, permease component n=1 Tax=Methanomethylovorans hollandica (strain DSM 15978 / NBRC 107637 / DMS1) TaxID=867904 RepID=L0KX66_METHD|nr:SufD family Fe-S cluster assembly protein [Methanomethylovorans hollandica]AGB49716.1 ABC-type transport system involved in Fe-S cluster assembly, permease component [Methanomethylovorans hollandica DSM 15978]